MKIFLSYGRDVYEKLAIKLKEDLQKENFHVWFDKENIRESQDWEIKIEEGILASEWLFLIMTHHSVRRPAGVCLDEVSYARFLGKKILPIMLQTVQPPLCISRVQYIDFAACFDHESASIIEVEYQKRLEIILKILKGETILELEGTHTNLLGALNPLDNDVYLKSIKDKYYGREWLFKSFEKWQESDNQVFMIFGKAGTGKSRFVIELVNKYHEVSAVHFCKYNDNDRSNPKKAIMSLAYYLSTQISAYYDEVIKLNDLNKLETKNVTRLFEYLLIEPFLKIPVPDRKVVVIIDALDESFLNGKNELLDIISNELSKLPKWLKFVVTSRPEPYIFRKLKKYNPIVIDANVDENNADLRAYYRAELKINDDKVLSQLIALSEDSFLYAVETVKAIKRGEKDISNLQTMPVGLNGVYEDYFNRLFSLNNKFDYNIIVRPILEVVVALNEPINASYIQAISSIDEYDFDDVLDYINTLFPSKDGYIELLHKSLYDWIIDRERSGNYRVSLTKGNEKIVNFLTHNNEQNLRNYKIKHFTKHAINAGQYDVAITTLKNLELQTARIDLLSFDTAINLFFMEIQLINEKQSHDILTSDAFIGIFSKYRRFFFDYGLYVRIKALGFEPHKVNCENVDYKMSLLYYFYITEDFEQTIVHGNKLLIDPAYQKYYGDIYNTIALSYRKFVNFSLAVTYFKEVAKHTNNLQELSIAVMNLGKIAYHSLRFNEAYKYNEEGIHLLKEYLNTPLDDDLRLMTKLFLAEYYRLSAETAIWHKDFRFAKDALAKTQAIYDSVTARDRYYVRFLYTAKLLTVVSEKQSFAEEEFNDLIAVAKNSYDYCQIVFVKAIGDYLHAEQTAELSHADKLNGEIKAYREKAEIKLLSALQNNTEHEIAEDNSTIHHWINYVENYLRELKCE